MEFRYQPLEPNEIRVLRPLSQSSDSLSFKIVHVSLLSKPRYAALSYTWGTEGETHKILLNGQHLRIRQNLHDALQRIQNSKLKEEYLWVDAVCINQGEDGPAKDERSVQITLMKQVYEQAGKVLVWLGNPENEVNNRLAFPLMKEFAKRFRYVLKKARPYRPWWKQHKPQTNGEDIADFLFTISPTEDRKVFDVPGSQTYRAWLGIISLWKSRWWTRTWIFHESTIPDQIKIIHFSGIYVQQVSSKVRFLCGDQEATWLEFDATSLVASTILISPSIDSHFLVGANTLADKLSKLRSKRVLHLRWTFLDILQMFRHTQCSDPRDKVYAPLCLAPNDVHHFIKPDYATETVLDVYIRVVRYCFAQPGHDLDFLGHAMYQEETQVVETPKGLNSEGVKSVLPSWVPNFSASLNLVPIPKTLHVPVNLDPKGWTFYDTRAIPSDKEKVIAAYRPLGDISSNPLIEGNRLWVSGVCIDILKDMIPIDGPDHEANLAAGKETGRKWGLASKHKYFTCESYGDAMKRTQVLDIVYDERSRPSERGGKVDHAFLRRPRADLSLVEYRYQMNIRTALYNASTLRRLGRSQNHYLLKVPNTAVVGDEIWALAGGQALYMLRSMDREAGEYRFMGECYAHGLMDGEIVRRLDLGEVRMEDVSLV